MDKQCSRCRRVLDASMFSKAKTAIGLQGNCKECARAASQAWASANAEALREYNKLWMRKARAESPERFNTSENAARARAWREKNPERFKELLRRKVDGLSDGYVARLIGARAKDIPAVLVATKRTQVQIQRLLKERQHEEH